MKIKQETLVSFFALPYAEGDRVFIEQGEDWLTMINHTQERSTSIPRGEASNSSDFLLGIMSFSVPSRERLLFGLEAEIKIKQNALVVTLDDGTRWGRWKLERVGGMPIAQRPGVPKTHLLVFPYLVWNRLSQFFDQSCSAHFRLRGHRVDVTIGDFRGFYEFEAKKTPIEFTFCSVEQLATVNPALGHPERCTSFQIELLRHRERFSYGPVIDGVLHRFYGLRLGQLMLPDVNAPGWPGPRDLLEWIGPGGPVDMAGEADLILNEEL